MKTSPEDVTVLLVGGGGIIVPEQLSGVGRVVRPPYFSVANAVGAAMAKGKCPVSFHRIIVGSDKMSQSRETLIQLNCSRVVQLTM